MLASVQNPRGNAGGQLSTKGNKMRRVLAIARNTFRETIRDKILYNLILFALIMILSSLALGQLTLGNEDKVILDLGLSSISIFGMLIAIFIGIGLVYKELEKRTVYILLAKPVHRYELILGKYLGLLFTLCVNLAIMTVGLELALAYTGRIAWGGYLRIFPAVYLIFLSLALVTALALLFSAFSTPALSALFTFFLWIIGHFSGDLQNFGELTKSETVKWLCRVLYYVIPNLSDFRMVDSRSVIQSSGYFQMIDPLAIMGATVYCLLYCTFILSLSIWIFTRRDFK
jgi:ABC-type transport system involved in multi-copper enzyme maturation permease subunit